MEWGTVFSIATTILSIVVASFVALKNRAHAAEKEAQVARFESLEASSSKSWEEHRRIGEKMHAAELKMAEQDGDLKVAKATHSKLERDVEEIKDNLVRRDEFDAQMRALHEQLAEFGRQLTEILKQRRR